MSDADHGHDDHGHDDHGHAHQSPFIQHHYDDAQHQFDAGKFAIWIFLAQEVLFFSALFVAYVAYRVHHGEIYSYAHKWLDVRYGATNTAILIFSSFTAAWAVRAAQLGQRRRLILCISVTILCACGFLGIKYLEYSHKVHEHILYGRYFDPCVSPGGEELLTKRNLCMGAKGSVVWDWGANKASEGCFETAKLDLDTTLAGVQADCVVTVVKVDDKGKELGPASPGAITNRCPDELLTLLNGEHETASRAGKQLEKEAEPQFPCWRPAYQPDVCPDLTSPEQRAHGVGSKSQVGILVEYGDHLEREGIKVKATCKDATTAKPLDALAISHEQRVDQVGERTIRPVHHLTPHEEQEIESLGPPPEHTSMFLTLYFLMTGLHGVHVFFGIVVFIWLLIRSIKGQFTPDYFGPIDFAALYWHIVDLIWIFLFPLLYLIH
ncbi:MAG: cytochrome c oxidase subunit 3 [Kofleriaceae bacterium]